MKKSIIVAMTEDRLIGAANKLPWHLPEDLKHFKKITTGHPIIMGRKTYDSIGRPLPGRRNVVITRQQDWRAPGVEVVHDLNSAFSACGNIEEAFVIGGSEIFAQALPSIDRLYLTILKHPFSGDTYFPEFDLHTDFKILTRETHQSAQEPRFEFEFMTAERHPNR